MVITICGSMVFSKEMLDTKDFLEEQGHSIFISNTTKHYLGRSKDEASTLAIRIKNTSNAIKEHYNHINNSDAILVLNYDRKGIKNYIGGNSFLEIGFAHVLEKKIFLLNPIPKIEFYASEIKSMRPKILKGDFSKIL